jgi:hypothetical protein
MPVFQFLSIFKKLSDSRTSAFGKKSGAFYVPANPGFSTDYQPLNLVTALYTLDVSAVPNEISDLIYLAESWGIADDIARLNRIRQAGMEEKRFLLEALKEREASIDAWLFSIRNGNHMTAESTAFMFLLTAVAEVREELSAKAQ